MCVVYLSVCVCTDGHVCVHVPEVDIARWRFVLNMVPSLFFSGSGPECA